MERPDQIGGKDKRPFEDRDHEQIMKIARGNFMRELGVPLGDGGCRKQDLDVLAADKRHDSPREKKSLAIPVILTRSAPLWKDPTGRKAKFGLLAELFRVRLSESRTNYFPSGCLVACLKNGVLWPRARSRLTA